MERRNILVLKLGNLIPSFSQHLEHSSHLVDLRVCELLLYDEALLL